MRAIFVVICLSFCIHCQSADQSFKSVDYKLNLDENTLSVVSYNVENLFDTRHDPGSEDWEFLPLKNADGSPNQEKIKACKSMSPAWRKDKCLEVDWTEDKLQIKLDKIHEVISLQGDLPDVLALIEVENQNILGQVAQKLGYQVANSLITSGSDDRGINVALLYRDRLLELLDWKELEVREGNRVMDTRNLLVANFKVKNSSEVLGIYVNHWPSQGNPVKDRMAAANTLKRAYEEQKAKYSKKGTTYHAVVVGDFNVTNFDRPHPIISVVESDMKFSDTLTLLKQNDEDLFLRLPTGTSYYVFGTSWDYLDKILVSESLLQDAEIQVDKKSFRILGLNEISKSIEITNKLRHAYNDRIERIPNRYNFLATTLEASGYSDHYPVRISIKIRP